MAPPTQPQPSQPVRLARAADLQTSGGQTDGMLRQNAITNLCDGICASLVSSKSLLVLSLPDTKYSHIDGCLKC